MRLGDYEEYDIFLIQLNEFTPDSIVLFFGSREMATQYFGLHGIGVQHGRITSRAIEIPTDIKIEINKCLNKYKFYPSIGNMYEIPFSWLNGDPKLRRVLVEHSRYE